MKGHGAKLGRKQEEAIAALLSQRNIEEAARAVGIGTRTLFAWLHRPEFDAAYRQARRAAFSQSIGRLQQASSAAVATLMKVMVDPHAPAASRVRAADCVLNQATRGLELEDLEVRVRHLEEMDPGT
jgi:transposase-like protein